MAREASENRASNSPRLRRLNPASLADRTSAITVAISPGASCAIVFRLLRSSYRNGTYASRSSTTESPLASSIAARAGPIPFTYVNEVVKSTDNRYPIYTLHCRILMSKLLEGKLALVMGIANRWSIAYPIAQAFSREGAALVLTYLGDRQKESITELSAGMNVASILPCDVTKEDDLAGLTDSLRAVGRPLDAVVHS